MFRHASTNEQKNQHSTLTNPQNTDEQGKNKTIKKLLLVNFFHTSILTFKKLCWYLNFRAEGMKNMTII
jgi:hypothetical protein